MSQTTKTINHECRTCFNATKGWIPLSAKTRDYKKRLKSYAELLQDITNINIMDNKSVELPQIICGKCSRRLKSAHNFIQQAAEVNEQLNVMLNDQKFQCLQETQIDVETCMEIKEEPELTKANLECLEETPIDLEPCIEIKIENEANEKRKETFDCSKKKQILGKVVVEVYSEEECKRQGVKQCNSNETNKLEKKSQRAETINESDVESQQSKDSEWQEDNIKFNRKKVQKGIIKPNEEQDPAKKNNEYTDDIAVPCDKCNKIFKNSKLLAVHQRISHIPEEKKCTCKLCGNKFTRYCNMYKHMRTFHGPETVTLISKRPEEDYIYKCDKCHKKYSRKKSLIYHTKLKHSLNKVEEKTESNTNNNKSLKSMDKGSLCPICGSSFTSKTQLTVHLRRHTGERPFKCDLCERAFLLVTQLNSHKRLHTGEKPYKCQVCEKTFRVSDDLRQHMRTHTNERPHKCLQCERSFKHTQDLKIHLRSHTGERPYVCAVCGDSFQRYNTLRAHRLRMGHVEHLRDNNSKKNIVNNKIVAMTLKHSHLLTNNYFTYL
ncbi:zinc finger protein 675-like [Lucilia cuprina]|uniref:zinc finger protein 675-like n=1 Tax=Lucilia cuprina TaxID=7375 RepID=UPI001F06DE2B|nr:zinc finger protein 675-like [Lucilia cuprina]